MRRTTSSRSVVVGAVLALLVTVLPGVATAQHRDTVTTDGLVTAVRWAGADRFDTAARLAVEAASSSIADPSTSVVLATGRNFPDALAGTYLAGQVDAPILLTERDSIPTSTLDAITGDDVDALAVDTVYLLGGPLAISLTVENDLEDRGIEVVRLAGLDRAETAARIATEAPEGEVGIVDGLRTAVVARSNDFPDALVAGAAASGASLPLLLTDTDALPAATAGALAALDIEQVIVAGGPVAVSDAVVGALAGRGYEVRRVFGNSRTETAIAFARFNQQEFGFATDEVGLARADDFPDALSFAAFAGREQISVTLARDPLTLDIPTRAHLASIGDCRFQTLYVPGGTVAISDAVLRAARSSLTTEANCAGVDTDGPDLDQAALESLGATTADDRRAAPAPGDVVVTALFDEPVVCTGDVPEQFRLVSPDDVVDATSIDCAESGSTTVVVGFPAGSITSLDAVDLRYQVSGDPAARLMDVAGNDATSPLTARLASGIVVNTTRDAVDANPGDGTCAIADGGRCSLRAAVQEANASPGTDVVFVPEGDFDLTIAGADEDAGTTGDLDIDGDVAILGSGPNTVVTQTVDDRVVDVLDGEVTLSSLTLTGGNVVDAAGKGGGIQNVSLRLRLDDVLVRGNHAGLAGGGVENGGAMGLFGTRLVDNTAGANGAGLHATGEATTSIQGGVVRDNVAGLEGGGVWNGIGAMAVNGTTFTDNTASGDSDDQGGGSMFNAGGSLTVIGVTATGGVADGTSGSGGGIMTDGGSLTVVDSTIADSTASRAGGGVENRGGEVTVTDTTLSGNDAGTNPGNGGGLHAGGGTTNVLRTTVDGNTAVEGGGLWVGGDGEMVVMDSSLVGNAATGGNGGTAGERQGGGGAYNDGATLTFDGGDVTGNTATNGSGSGGGVLTADGVLVVDGTLFDSNVADRAGGGIEVDLSPVDGVRLGDTDAPTFTGNRATGTNSGAGIGGAVHMAGVAEVTITDMVATANEANEGGALWVGPDSVLTMDGGEVTDNVATAGDATTPGLRQGGGGAFNDGGTLDLNGGTFAGNTAIVSNGSGGGIMASRGSTTIDDVLITGNTADRAGGGVEVDLGQVTIGGSTVISDNVATGDNSGAGNGGGVHATASMAIGDDVMIAGNTAVEGGGVWVGNGATLTLNGPDVVGNVAVGGDAATPGQRQGGGGAYNAGATLTVTGGLFDGNVAITGAGSGGGILNAGASAAAAVSGTTFTANVADRAGGAIENDGGTLTTTNANFGQNVATGSNSAGNGGAVHAAGGTTTITGGLVSDNTAVEGGGVWIGGDGDMTVDAAGISLNEAVGDDADQGGGGAFVQGGAGATLTLTNTSVNDNDATGASGSGGGILNNGGVLDVTGGTIGDDGLGNTANRAGGGIEAVNGTTTLDGVTVRANAADGGGAGPGAGGGLHITGSSGTVGITNSNFRANVAATHGGGLWNGGSAVTVGTSTFEANDAGGFGGALYDQGGTTDATNVTLSANTADVGGSVYATGPGAVTLLHVTSFRGLATTNGNELATGAASGTIEATNSIVVDGAGADGACSGSGISSGGGNYAEASCAFGDTTGDTPGLGDLTILGGQRVHPLTSADSGAVDVAADQGVDVDQAGQDRPSQPVLSPPIGNFHDAGAFEFQHPGII